MLVTRVRLPACAFIFPANQPQGAITGGACGPRAVPVVSWWPCQLPLLPCCLADKRKHLPQRTPQTCLKQAEPGTLAGGEARLPRARPQWPRGSTMHPSLPETEPGTLERPFRTLGSAQGEATVAAGASDASLSFSGTEPGTLGKAFASLGLPKASHSGRGHRAASAVV